MMNRNEKLEIAKRLRLSTESELSRDDLEQMLDAELSKPEAEMDTELVQQILEMLEETPSQVQQREAWRKTDKRLKLKQWQPVVTGLTKIAAVGVILVALMFATYGTAQALNWEFLLRWIRPFAETFMVYTGDKPTPTPLPQGDVVYDDFTMTFTQQEFTTLADCPDKIDGYPVKPVWMPARFAHLQSSLYSDLHVTSISHLFNSSEGWCIVDITKFGNNKDATSYYYEQLPDDNTSMYVTGHQIAFYYNTDNTMLSASWLFENTNYVITGTISRDEIISIIESMMK